MKTAKQLWGEMNQVGYMLVYSFLAQMEGAQFIPEFSGQHKSLDSYKFMLCGLHEKTLQSPGYRPALDLLELVWDDICTARPLRSCLMVGEDVSQERPQDSPIAFFKLCLQTVMERGDPYAKDSMNAWRWQPCRSLMPAERLVDYALQSLQLFPHLPAERKQRQIYDWQGTQGSLNPLSYPSIEDIDAINPLERVATLKAAYVGQEANYLLPPELRPYRGVSVVYNNAPSPSLSVTVQPRLEWSWEELLMYFNFIGQVTGSRPEQLRLMMISNVRGYEFHGGFHLLGFNLDDYLKMHS